MEYGYKHQHLIYLHLISSVLKWVGKAFNFSISNLPTFDLKLAKSTCFVNDDIPKPVAFLLVLL